MLENIMSHDRHRQDPVFLLSPGRSGSTLLQRYLNCSTDLVLWGEHGGFLRGLRNTYLMWCENQSAQNLLRQGRQHSALLISSRPAMGVDVEWTNTLSRDDFREKLTQMVTGLFTIDVPPSMRWGFKEIRYDDKDIAFLRELFPLAQCVFIVRDPIDTLASAIVALAKGQALWEESRISEQSIKSIREQIEVWSKRLSSIAGGIAASVDKKEGYLLRYEALKANPVEMVGTVCQYLRISPPPVEHIRLIAEDVRHGMNTRLVRQRLKDEFIKEPGIQDMLRIYRSLGYEYGETEKQSLWTRLFKPGSQT